MSELSQDYIIDSPVDSPVHYQSENGIECWDAIEAALTPEEFRGFLKGNVFKYLWREGKKDPAKLDLDKAARYLEKLNTL